ncbi:hypothetical protein CCR75_001456 [Bremia lactucae]|uniref:DNA endonuclease activator Ctp1 C-terminal domain-containing protein n=1 Tax=Bremia lactucae TaxID=4779 RepID=A0A976ILY5_BRELC|nr:hypothetical protein CCR75_001456 [Bremia lactucae]
MAWQEEKKALLAIIRSHEQKATLLAKRFKLLQQTLQEQQKLLNRYQIALRSFQTAYLKNRKKTSNDITSVDSTADDKQQDLAAFSWVKKKSVDLTEQPSIVKNSMTATVEKQAKEKKADMTFPLQDSAKRTSRMAPTWAEEKQRDYKKPKRQQARKLAATGADKENVEMKQAAVKPKHFAYVEVVRNQDERKALPAHDCVDCKKYFDALGEFSAIDAAQYKTKCSRHRARFEPYQTPDDFWRLSFPDSEPEIN